MFNRKSARITILTMVIVALLALTLSVNFAAKAQESKSDSSTPIVGIYGQLSARWWEWITSIPWDENPGNAEGYFDASVGQEGFVWFLAGTFGDGPVVRECTIPKGKYLFFPVINYFGWSPDDGKIREIRAFAEWIMNKMTDVQCTVDGIPMNIVRTGSPAFGFVNVIGYDLDYDGEMTENDVKRNVCASDGYFVLVTPLPPGNHQIHFYGALYVPEWQWGFEVDVTFNITVVE